MPLFAGITHGRGICPRCGPIQILDAARGEPGMRRASSQPTLPINAWRPPAGWYRSNVRQQPDRGIAALRNRGERLMGIRASFDRIVLLLLIVALAGTVVSLANGGE